jgi:sugar phosphate isomerase/epimerase
MNIDKKHTKYGFSQGRLTVPYNGELQCFPQHEWQNEFKNAGLLGFSFIELLVERERNNLNPIWSNEGRLEILELCTKNNLKPYSICLDYIINHSLLDDPNKSAFSSIIESLKVAADLNCSAIILPLLEKSNLSKSNFMQMAEVFRDVAPVAHQYNIVLCIECLVSASELNEFISLVNMNNVKAVFDTGNRVIETPDLYNEILILSENLGHVHIKDKDRTGNNVILGSGLVDFCGVFSALEVIGYEGPFNFETNRGSIPLDTAKHNINFCKFFAMNQRNSKTN